MADAVDRSDGARESAAMIHVLVVARVRLYREGLAQALASEACVNVVGTVASTARARAAIEELAPGTVVLDVADADPAFVRELTDWRPELRVIAFALLETPPNIIEWAEAGVAGFVTDEGTVLDLREAVVGAARSELFCSPLAAGTLLRRVRTLAPGSLSDVSLSPRELEIAQLMEQGLMNKQIALRLGIELPTVKNHVHRILEKLGVHRRADAATRIRRAGLALRDWSPD